MPGALLSLSERDEIAVALIEDPAVAWAVIGRRIGPHPTTIALEVTAGGGRDRYRPATAQRRAERDRCRPRLRRLEHPGVLRDRVTDELRLGRSPVAIWADLVAEDIERVCVESVYATAVYAGVLEVKARACLRMRRALGGRSDRRSPQPVLDAQPHRTRHPPLDPGHHAMRLRRRRDGWRPRRRSRPDPSPPPGVDHLRPRIGVGELGDHSRPLRRRLLVLRTPLAMATRPSREHQPAMALVVPTRHRPRRHHPRTRRPRRQHHQRPTPPQPQLPITNQNLGRPYLRSKRSSSVSHAPSDRLVCARRPSGHELIAGPRVVDHLARGLHSSQREAGRIEKAELHKY